MPLSNTVEVVTSWEGTLLQRREISLKSNPSAEFDLLRIEPSVEYQRLIGFGGACTEASATVYAQMSPDQQQQLIDGYFGLSGNCYCLTRTSIQSCDFGNGSYTYVSNPWDKDLSSFSLAHDQEAIIPLVKDALGANPNLQVLASPWSPPGFMKTNLIMKFGGHLKDKYLPMWASMMARYAREMRDSGIPVTRLTLQNEPRAEQIWESCIFTDAQLASLALDLRKALDAQGLQDVKILGWDHNKERLLESALNTYDATGDVLDGMAFHWYTGDHFEMVAEVAARWPQKELIMTEGCEAFSHDPHQEYDHAFHYAHDILGDLNAGAQGWIDWNLLLDEKGGPNHVKNFCSAPARFNRQTKQLDFLPSYYYIGHFSRFILPGAVRILCSKPSYKIEATAWKNPNGSIVVVILSLVGYPQDYSLFIDGYTAPLHLEPWSVQTVRITM